MPTVLIVDDSAFDRQLAASTLEQHDSLNVETVDGGVAALARLPKGGIDLVVTDLQMPMLDGMQLVMSIRNDHPEIPVILLTGEGSELVAMEALSHGAVNYVPKKFIKDWLSRTVMETLATQNAERNHKEIFDVATYSEFRMQLHDSQNLIASTLQQVEHTASGILSCNKSDIVRIGIAVKEAIEHALKNNSHIEFEYLILPTACRFKLRSGEPDKTIFDVGELPTRNASEEFNSENGRAFFLIRSHLNDVQIDDGGREATLTFRIDGQDSSEKN